VRGGILWVTTKIELGEVRELTESTDWFLPFHLLHLQLNGTTGFVVRRKRWLRSRLNYEHT
jgi:hypothetical protein